MADEQAGADEQSQDIQGAEGDTSTEDTSNDSAAGEDADSSDADAGEQQQDDESSDADEPPVRKSAKDFIIERKDRKIKKLEGESEGADDAAGKDTSDVRSIIREELAPITQSFAKSADEQELQAALTKYPEAKKAEKTIRRYMASDAYARVPVEFIVRGILGARETAKKQADEKAKASRQGGHQRRPAETKVKSAWELSDKEFEKSVSDLMSGKTQ
jgi:hypothetical protein